jgi:peptidoglycan L-alanyl-D-glutamate endopeptidase CwlK
MSTRLFARDVMFKQRFLASCGFYDGLIDGYWGARTDAAVKRFEVEGAAIATELGTFDPASERCILTLHPQAQRAARALLARVRAGGLEARVLSGIRTYAEQDLLYRKGRSSDRSRVVTGAQGGHSAHNFGIAWDIGIFTSDGRYRMESGYYERAAAFGKAPGIEWGWRLDVVRGPAALSARDRGDDRGDAEHVRSGIQVCVIRPMQTAAPMPRRPQRVHPSALGACRSAPVNAGAVTCGESLLGTAALAETSFRTTPAHNRTRL